ncbi:hypothetical protein M0R45_016585 [Rubus argutus]|uniref:Uncharacterized protein n=1 Tax=Rubus argutus TaxID=59490 RepID=A0AAW1XT05_RUBAR
MGRQWCSTAAELEILGWVQRRRQGLELLSEAELGSSMGLIGLPAVWAIVNLQRHDRAYDYRGTGEMDELEKKMGL